MSGLPPLACNDEIMLVFKACRAGKALVSRDRSCQTERYLLQVWQTTFVRLQQAVADHIELNRKVYVKYGDKGAAIGMEANVTLYEDLNVYVFMRIQAGYLVILAAHSHYTPPLPQ